MLLKILRGVLLLFFITPFCFGQSDSAKRIKKVKILPVPAFGYAPETKAYVGAVSLFTINLDSNTRTSNAKAEINYTQRKQFINEIGLNIFTKNELYFIRSFNHFSKYPDQYFGIGSTSDSSVSFSSNRLIFDEEVFKNIKRQYYIGLGFRFIQYYNIIDSSSNYYTELENRKNLGVKLGFLFDKRNNILTPTSGKYLDLDLDFNFSKEMYTHILFDYRIYKPLLKGYNSLRLYHKSTIGNPPFYDYSVMGGDKFTRGYFYGRFRDKNFTTVQYEYRKTIYKRIGVSVFGGYSYIRKDFYINDNRSLKQNYGLGLRYTVDKKEKTNLRFDFAWGALGESGFYVSFGESF